jgi:signal peptidase I
MSGIYQLDPLHWRIMRGFAKRTLASVVPVFTLGLLLSGCNRSPHPYRVVSGSMSPLIQTGDRIVVDESVKARTDLHDGDVIMLRRDGDVVVIKRILAMPGETIRGEDRKLFRDGKQVDEPYLAPVEKEGTPWMTSFPARTVPAGEVFVLGDNRDNSLDSRAPEYAPVKFSDVVGKYSWTYWQAASEAK